MEGSRAARRRQLANLYQCGSEDSLLRRRRPRKGAPRLAESGVRRDKEMVRREEENALYGTIAETVQFGQRWAWHYGYRNQPGLSGSGPLAAASRYGAVGTLRMIRRDASARRGGGSRLRGGGVGEGIQVDEWCPMLRSSSAPSLATTTTPKVWPESAMYPHGSQPKRLQASPWYDGETTANSFSASAAGPGIRRVAASHGFTMSILERDALLESKSAHTAAPLHTGLASTSPKTRPSSAVASARGAGVGPRGGGRAVAHVRTPKRLDQEIGFLRVGTCFTAPKDPLGHGLDTELAARLARQTDQDGLKWDLLKQVLKVVTGSQHGLPLQAVQEVAATFGAAVGTSAMATKAQFIDHITGKHVGFPESELSTLFGFFRAPMALSSDGTAPASRKPGRSRQERHGGRLRGGGGPAATPLTCSKTTTKGGGAYGADWVLAVASLRLLARPKESMMEATLGVFEVFARARGDRIRHRRRLERERFERERQRQLQEERDRWKRRRRREEEMGVSHSTAVSIPGPEKHSTWGAPLCRDSSGRDGCGEDDADGSSGLNRASFAETARMFTLVCSNDQERHAVTTTYRHRFRLELRAVLQERRQTPKDVPFRNSCNQYHRAGDSNDGGGRGGGGGGGNGAFSSNKGVRPGSSSPSCGNRSSSDGGKDINSPSQSFGVSNANREAPGSSSAKDGEWRLASSRSGPELVEERRNEQDLKGRSSPGGEEEKGVTAEEFSEALVRCPEMLEAFGNQLAARFRHRHRPIWMAPFLRKGD